MRKQNKSKHPKADTGGSHQEQVTQPPMTPASSVERTTDLQTVTAPAPPESPEHRDARITKEDRFWELRRATKEAWVPLDNATAAAKAGQDRLRIVAYLKEFWLARRDDHRRRAIQAEFPNFVDATWAIMRKLGDETGISPPVEPVIHSSAECVEAYCRGLRIPVKNADFRNTIDRVLEWCRQVESGCPQREQPAPSDDEPQEDGPEEPDGFWFQGLLYGGLAPRCFNALTACWSSRLRRASRADLAEAVWGDRSDRLSADEEGLATLRRDLNAFFRENNIAYHARVKSRYLCIDVGPPRPRRT